MKNKNLFLDFSASEESHAEISTGKNAGDFKVNDVTWDSLLTTPTFQKHLQMWIEKKAADQVQQRVKALEDEAERIRTELAEVLKKNKDRWDGIEKEAHEKGYQEGLLAGLRESVPKTTEVLKQLLQDLNRMTTQIMEEKETLLHEHEALFSKTVTEFLQKKCVPNASETKAQIEGLLEKYHAEFHLAGKIDVFVSKPMWVRFDVAGLMPAKDLHWNLKLDETLRDGEIRFDVSGHGMMLCEGLPFADEKVAA